VPALDFRRGRRALRAIEDNSKRVTIDADNLKFKRSIGHAIQSFMIRHRNTQSNNGVHDGRIADADAALSGERC
jgi:hypothetical protein